MIKCDFHMHSFHSSDCNMSFDTIIRTCLRRRIDCIAITDHNTFSAALSLQSAAPFRVIPGEEVKTSQGEIIGLFLKEEIPRGLSPGATVEAIREQGGVVYVPHPFDRLRKGRLVREALLEVLEMVDVIETYNARITFPADVRTAERFCREHGKIQGAGSDAHVWWELGRSFVEMPEFEGREQFLDSLSQGKIHGRLSWPAVHLATSLTKFRRKYLRR